MIGELRESSLHASLKTWYFSPGDLIEAPVDGYFIDLVRWPLLIEIQTGSFSSIKAKVRKLLEDYPVRIIYPIAIEKWIVKVDLFNESVLNRRKSPKRGTVYDSFRELVRIAGMLSHPNFSLDIVLTREEDIWSFDNKGSWRRKGWSIIDRRLIEVVSSCQFLTPKDYEKLLPNTIPNIFTVKEVAQDLHLPLSLAGKFIYCLRLM